MVIPIEYKIWEIRQLHMGKMELKFWKIRDRRHIPIKLLRLGFGSRLIFQDQDRNVTLLPKPLNVIFTDTF